MRAQQFVTALVAVLLAGTALAAPPPPAEQDPLTMGIFPRRSPSVTMRMFRPLADYLTQKLDRPVILETAPDFASFWKNVVEQRYDIVHYNQYHYVRSHRMFNYRAIAKNEEFGSASISAAIVVRKDSGITSLRGLRGRKIAFGGGRKAMVSYIMATYLLRQSGLQDGDYLSQFALTPPKACVAVYFHQAAAAGVGHHVLDLPNVKRSIDRDQMRYLAISEPVAHLPWAVSPRVNESTTRAIQALMSALGTSAQGKRILNSAALTGLHRADDSDYDTHRRIIRVVLGEEF